MDPPFLVGFEVGNKTIRLPEGTKVKLINSVTDYNIFEPTKPLRNFRSGGKQALAIAKSLWDICFEESV